MISAYAEKMHSHTISDEQETETGEEGHGVQ